MQRTCGRGHMRRHISENFWSRSRASQVAHGMAGSSSDPIGADVHHPEDDASLALALRLQEAEDAALALSLQESEDAAQPPPQPAATPSARAASGAARLPGELLGGPAHKAVQHLGRGTAKKLEAHFKTSLSLRELLRLFHGARREELLMLIDAGQRDRVEAELVALALDVSS